MSRKLISFDWAIKKILRSKAYFSILEGFLSELLAPDKDLKIIKILEAESNKDHEDDKCNRVDILVEIEPEELVLIEVQVNREVDFFHRMLYGTSKIITEYIAEGQSYAKIKKVYSVNIIYFDLGHGKDYLYKGTTDFFGVHNNERLQLSERQKYTYKKGLVSDIYPEYYIIKVNSFDDLAKNSLDEWIYFFKHEEIKNDFHAKGLLAAKKELDILKLSDQERKAYAHYKDNLHYQASMIESSYHEGLGEGIEKGLEQGIEKGIEQSKEAIASNMLQANLPIEQISKLTGLAADKITALLKQGKS